MKMMSYILSDNTFIDSEFNLLSESEEKKMVKENVPETLGILPLKNTVLFPGVIIPITVGRDKSIQLIKEYNKGDKTIGVVAQKSDHTEDPNGDDLYQVGTVAHIIKMLRMPDGNTTVILQGQHRIKIEEIIQEAPYFTARVTALPDKKAKRESTQFKAIADQYQRINRHNLQRTSDEAILLAK